MLNIYLIKKLKYLIKKDVVKLKKVWYNMLDNTSVIE